MTASEFVGSKVEEESKEEKQEGKPSLHYAPWEMVFIFSKKKMAYMEDFGVCISTVTFPPHSSFRFFRISTALLHVSFP